MLRTLLICTILMGSVNTVIAQSTWTWGRSIEIPNPWNINFSVRVNAVCSDKFGNCYATGYFKGDSVQFGPITLPDLSPYSYETFVVKYDAAGHAVWAITSKSSGTASAYGYSISTDSACNVVVTGAFQGSTVTFGSVILTKVPSTSLTSDVFLLKLDSNGNIVWAHSYGNSRSEEGMAVAADSVGNIWLAGLFDGDSLTIGSTTLYNISTATTDDIFLAKFDPQGNPVWAASGVGTATESVYGLCVDRYGNAFIAGEMGWSTTLSFGALQMSSPTGGGFIVKYNSTGVPQWFRQFKGGSGECLTDVDLDPSGNIYVSGYFYSGTSWFDVVPLTANNNCYEACLAKYDSAGTIQWARKISSGQMCYGNAVTVSSGNVYVMGTTQTNLIDLGTQVGSSSQSFATYAFIAMYDNTGKDICYGILASDQYNGSSKRSITPDNNFGIFVGEGYNAASMALGPDVLSPASGNGGVVARFTCAGGVAIPEIQDAGRFAVYPNPGTGLITVQTEQNAERITVINSLGEEVLRLNDCAQQTQLDLSEQPPGAYLIMINCGDQILRQKLILY